MINITDDNTGRQHQREPGGDLRGQQESMLSRTILLQVFSEKLAADCHIKEIETD